jgi:peptide chain release factor 1
MMDKLAALEERYNELSQELARPDVITDPVRLQQVAREHASLEPIISLYRQLRDSDVAIAETRELLHDGHDPELVELAREELRALEERREQLLQELRGALLPRDPNDEKDVIVEIRAAAGGEEAALFARDLFRMYTRYAEQQGWKVNVLSMYESGVHRVQRIPVTESSGRIHTSTATVIVLPKPEEVEIEIRPEDLRIEVFRSTGHGGQSVNTTDSAVRITHLPTGITASSQDERSQLQNRANAMAVLRARLYDLERRRREAEQGAARRSQVQSGDRSEKIRTYNFPQDRVTDHRIGLTLHNLQAVLDGEIGELIELLATADRAEKLQTVAST